MSFNPLKWIKGWRLDKFFDGISHKLSDAAKQAIETGTKIVDAVKTIDTSHPEILDVLTGIVPGTFDDNIKTKLRTELPKILQGLQLANACENETDPTAIVQCALKALQEVSPEFKKDFWDSLAVHISVVVADGQLDWHDAKYVLKYYYDHIQHHDVEAEATAVANN